MRCQKKFEQSRKPKFYLQKYHKLGYDIERMFEQKIRMERKRTYCPLFTTIGINAEAQTVLMKCRAVNEMSSCFVHLQVDFSNNPVSTLDAIIWDSRV